MEVFSQPSGEPVGVDAGKPLACWGAPRPQAGLVLGDVWVMLERQAGMVGPDQPLRSLDSMGFRRSSAF